MNPFKPGDIVRLINPDECDLTYRKLLRGQKLVVTEVRSKEELFATTEDGRQLLFFAKQLELTVSKIALDDLADAPPGPSFNPTHILTEDHLEHDKVKLAQGDLVELINTSAKPTVNLYRDPKGNETWLPDSIVRKLDGPDGDEHYEPDIFDQALEQPYEDNIVTSDEMDRIADATWGLPFDPDNTPKLYSPNALNINIDASLRPSDGLPGYHLQGLPYE